MTRPGRWWIEAAEGPDEPREPERDWSGFEPAERPEESSGSESHWRTCGECGSSDTEIDLEDIGSVDLRCQDCGALTEEW